MQKFQTVRIEGETRLVHDDRVVIRNAVQEAVYAIGSTSRALGIVNHGVPASQAITAAGLRHMMKVGVVGKAWVAVQLYWGTCRAQHPVPVSELAGLMPWNPERPEGTPHDAVPEDRAAEIDHKLSL